MSQFDLKEYLEEALKDEDIFDESVLLQEDLKGSKNQDQAKAGEDRERKQEKNKLSFTRKKKKSKQRKKTSSSSKKLAVLVFIIFLSLASYFLWDRSLSFERINPFELIMIKENGVDGYGHLEIMLKDSLDDEMQDLAKHLNFVVFENENIRVGDVKKVYLELDEAMQEDLKEAKIKLEPLETKYTVKALSERKSIDLFKDLEVDYHYNKGRLLIDEIHLNLSDQSLLDLIEFKHPISVEFHETYEIEIVESKELLEKLGEKGYQAETFSHELVAENIDYIPTNMKDIEEYESLKGRALRRIDEDYQKNNLEYHSFEVKTVCYSFYPENQVNAQDYYEGHQYEDGSLMFIIEFKQETGSTTNTLADNYGYTKMYFRDGSLLEEKMKLMSPFQDKASVESIRHELEMNNFKCEVTE